MCVQEDYNTNNAQGSTRGKLQSTRASSVKQYRKASRDNFRRTRSSNMVNVDCEVLRMTMEERGNIDIEHGRAASGEYKDGLAGQILIDSSIEEAIRVELKHFEG